MNEGRRNWIIVWIAVAPLMIISWVFWLIRLPFTWFVKGVEKVCSWVDNKVSNR